MLATRVKAVLIFIPLVLVMIWLGGWPFNLFITAILLISGFEFNALFKNIGYEPSPYLLLSGILLIVLQRWFLDSFYLEFLISLLIFITSTVALVQYESGRSNAAVNFAINLMGILYIGWVGSFFIPFRNLPNATGWMLTALPVVWLADCGAYFIGRWLGKKKLAPRLSPGKTWAGLAGGVLTGTLSGVLLILLWRSIDWLPLQTPLWQGAVMGLLLSILTPIGDLLISLFKRTANVKDTGNLIPGHGGMLDRIDSWIWAAMLGYYLVTLFNAL